jgi:diguanylate cyclase (GGDEF)-like protein/PAS domain S-box-containing protein
VAATGQRTSGDDAELVRVLHLEDNPLDAELVGRQLADDGLAVVSRVVASEITFRKAIADFAPQVVISDFSLPGFDGLAALRIAKEVAPATPFIFVSGTIGEERAIEALKRGAVDYVLKDNLRRLVPAIRAALREFAATRAKELAEEMLKRSESRLQDIINTSRDWIWECDQEGRFTFSSPSVLEILGYQHHELLGRRAADYVDSADELQMQATFAELTSEEQLSKALTLRWRHKSGRTRWLERSMVALRDANGMLTGVRGIDRDVTLRIAQEVRIRRLNRALRFVSGASSAVMRLRDRGQLLKESCRLAVSVGGYRKATIYLLPVGSNGAQPIICSFGNTEASGTKWTAAGAMPDGVTPVTQALATGQPVIVGDLADANDLGIRVADRDELLAAGLRACIALPLVMDGTSIGVVELHADEAGVFGDAELALLKQVADNITFSLRYLHSKESAEYLEYFDPLTSLANRSLYVQRLTHAIEDATRKGQRLALLVLDITGLGMINDGLGHHAGDLLLQLVAERLKNVFRDTNLMCRLGGDRFAVMSPDAAADAATVLKDQVACVFDAPFQIHDRELRVSVRAGLAQAPDDDRDAESILQHAQTALEHAKKAGERYLRHRPNMNAKASERLSLINDLRHAVSERNFILNYQPKIEVGSNRVDGVEALLRWPPKRGDAVPPNVFVPMLESLGLIDDVGAWVIVQALAESADWAPSDEEFRVAVNVSPLQLNREDFADRVLDLVASVARATRRLELEITESTLMADPKRASTSLARLRDAGVAIAIDDFGTGHSSLRVLSGLPVDVLKIDRSFVHDITTNRSHRIIVQTTINLASSLGLKTVAEGVETEEQAALLADLGCRSIQGYLIRRPAGAAETAQWLAAADPDRRERRPLSGRGLAPEGNGAEPVVARPRQQHRDN